MIEAERKKMRCLTNVRVKCLFITMVNINIVLERTIPVQSTVFGLYFLFFEGTPHRHKERERERERAFQCTIGVARFQRSHFLMWHFLEEKSSKREREREGQALLRTEIKH